jgi:hypothetical protein
LGGFSIFLCQPIVEGNNCGRGQFLSAENVHTIWDGE